MNNIHDIVKILNEKDKYLKYVKIKNVLNILDKELVNYIETNIIPQYKNFDRAHNENHVNDVIEYALKLSKNYKVSVNIVYTSAAYHDIGLLYDREKHHVHSSLTVRKDDNLKRWFSEEEICLIDRTCLEHRSSLNNGYSSIYSKIIADADKLPSLEIHKMIKRSYLYNLDTKPGKTNDEYFEIVYSHSKEKFGKGGYAKLILPESMNIYRLLDKEVQSTLSSKERTRQVFNKVIKEV